MNAITLSPSDVELIEKYNLAPKKLEEALSNLSEFDYLCLSLPNALDRVLVHQDGKATVRDALNHDIQHAYHHIDQILETRRVHDI